METDIGKAIDNLPLGWFHALHVARQALVTACFAVVIDAPAYIFPGMSAEYRLQADTEGFFSAVFTLGGLIGAALMSISDTFGRRPVIRWSASASVLATLLLLVPMSFAAVCVLRFFQGWALFM